MAKIGYLRVSTEEQKPDRQIDGLKPLCDKLYIERVSAAAKKRPIFERIMKELLSGDTLVVWDLDRAFRSTIDALTHTKQLQERGIQFQVVTMNIDTSKPLGEFFFTIAAAFGQLERRTISERTKEGLRAAVRRGKILGRKPILSKRQAIAAQQKLEAKEMTLTEIAALHGVNPTTISRSIKRLDKV